MLGSLRSFFVILRLLGPLILITEMTPRPGGEETDVIVELILNYFLTTTRRYVSVYKFLLENG